MGLGGRNCWVLYLKMLNLTKPHQLLGDQLPVVKSSKHKDVHNAKSGCQFLVSWSSNKTKHVQRQ